MTIGGDAAPPLHLVGYTFPTQTIVYTAKDVILYALGIGCTEEHYLYEHCRHRRHDCAPGAKVKSTSESSTTEGFAAFPTLALALPFLGSTGHRSLLPFPPPGMALLPPMLEALHGVGPESVLHGESIISADSGKEAWHFNIS